MGAKALATNRCCGGLVATTATSITAAVVLLWCFAAVLGGCIGVVLLPASANNQVQQMKHDDSLQNKKIALPERFVA